jgi:hypothetical protein
MMEPMKDEEMMAEETMPMEEPMAEEAPVEGELSPEEEQAASFMENMMGNYLDLPEEVRKRAQDIVMGPVGELVDTIIGTPVIGRLRVQLETSMGEAEEAPMEEPMAEEPTGIMSEAEAPMDEEEEMI